MKHKMLLLLCLSAGTLHAQQKQMQYFRPNNKQGLNVFETSRQDTIPFNGLKVQIGSGFMQDFQSLSHQNSAD